ncbi:MAG: superoxide dismutase [Bacteroidota bacterium]
MAFTLPDLPYAYDALEPHFDAQTMEIHHSKHHAGYTKKLNAAIEGTRVDGLSIESLLRSPKQAAIRNNGGGYYNHKLFWEVLSPNGGGNPSGDLGEAINAAFGSYDAFKEQFSTAAKTRFGSGWAWLIVKEDGTLAVTSTPNQDNPLMDVADDQGTPILGLDVWEHAYYLKYQNRRPDYVEAFFSVVNWEAVAANFDAAKK